MTLGPGAISLGRGVDKPKGIEQLNIDARELSSRGLCKAKSRRSSPPRNPKDECKVLEGRFFLRFPPSRRGIWSFTSLYNNIHRMWGSIGNRGTTADRDRRVGEAGGLSYGILRYQPRFCDYWYGMPCDGASFRLGNLVYAPLTPELHGHLDMP